MSPTMDPIVLATFVLLTEPVSNPCFTSFVHHNEIMFNQITTNIFLKAYKAQLD